MFGFKKKEYHYLVVYKSDNGMEGNYFVYIDNNKITKDTIKCWEKIIKDGNKDKKFKSVLITNWKQISTRKLDCSIEKN